MVFEAGITAEQFFFLLSALVALPAANAYLERRWHLALSGWLRFVIIVALVIMAGSLGMRDVSSIESPLSHKDVQSSRGPSTTSLRTLMDLDGSGTKTTEKFTTEGDWDLRYSYDCSRFGQVENFVVFITTMTVRFLYGTVV
jgi:hypothetical protein